MKAEDEGGKWRKKAEDALHARWEIGENARTCVHVSGEIEGKTRAWDIYK